MLEKKINISDNSSKKLKESEIEENIDEQYEDAIKSLHQSVKASTKEMENFQKVADDIAQSFKK